MDKEMRTEIISQADLGELSAYLDLAWARCMLLREMVEAADAKVLKLNVAAVMDALEGATGIIQAVKTVPIKHALL